VNIEQHLSNILTDPVGTVSGLAEILRQRAERDRRPPGLFYANPRRIFALRYHSEQVPNPDSRVTLTDRLDANGVPLPRIDLRFTDQDIDSVVAAHRLLERLVPEARWGRLSWMCPPSDAAAYVRSQARDGYHQIGLTRMSNSPRDGVVDSNLAVHGLRNLWVASTGVLPTGSQAHPTFAAVALALRLADHLGMRTASLPSVANL
jgi:choline dehydrogenase-like flavoprotein